MLSRFIANPSRHLRLLSLTLSPHIYPSSSSTPPPLPSFSRSPKFGSTHFISRHFSTHNNDDDNGQKPTSEFWKITPENDNLGAVFGDNKGGGNLTEFYEVGSAKIDSNREVLEGVQKGFGEKEDGVDEWLAGQFKPWNLGSEVKVEDVFDIGEEQQGGEQQSGGSDEVGLEMEKKTQDDLQLQKEEEELMGVLKGPNRAFGDLVAASGITDAMLDSLIALKDFKDIEGLPPLTEIEDKRYENSLKKSSRYEMELQKQEEIAKSRIRQVDEKGRAYGTGRRKCSIARVWIQPGEGKFLVNDKDFDVYFPLLDHRAALLRPFSETKTLGLWDVKCTVKGGGVSGQVGAIRLGISRALQNWEPGLRPPLREVGFLTRDPRVVERKKPGKAKARKSFQWVKR
uniref:Uncharacterized protein n=2 Tax=Opuntia streptacantha TaxID=393608 RepID=A0A7C9CLM5_OPUST